MGGPGLPRPHPCVLTSYNLHGHSLRLALHAACNFSQHVLMFWGLPDSFGPTSMASCIALCVCGCGCGCGCVGGGDGGRLPTGTLTLPHIG
jgi:hypothetical protein